ncbi:hypothetical protein [Pengzhenrongella phosphoraccumulans]|jgi:hypothetical protein|uniref:hypothetical protein n=1 Tax=Pengzhenrongella phosphoraccumulans TaxID=3114394 RepID=UPI00388FB6D3
MTGTAPVITVRRWRSRRSAAVAGIAFALLLMGALVMMRLALAGGEVASIGSDPERQALARISLNFVPFAGIAFLWFIGVVRDQLGDVEDRLFSTVFLGSGLLFLATLFQGAVLSASLLEMLADPPLDPGIWAFGGGAARALVSVYSMRMAAVFTLSVSTVAFRTAALPRWVAASGLPVALLLLVATSGRSWTELAFPTWVLVVSVAILVTRPRPPGVITPRG